MPDPELLNDEQLESEQQHEDHKTIAVRVKGAAHSQLQFIAQLSGNSMADEVRQAIDARIATAQDDPQLIARAQEVRAEIEREAAARSAAIAGFMGDTAVEATSEQPTPASARKSRRTSTATKE
jgi:lysyl-tRNA synthetase class II